MKRKATAIWNGSGLEGKGSLTSVSGVLDSTPYSTAMRFQNEDGKAGTNPEELLAAAHGGCFAMALSFGLSGEGFIPAELKVVTTVSIEKMNSHWEITAIHLDLTAKVPGIEDDKFQEIAKGAKENCPVSRALRAVEVTLSAKLA